VFSLQLEVRGDRQAAEGLQRLAGSLGDLSEPLRKILEDFRAITRERFASGEGWQPLAQSTIVDKKRRGHPMNILVRTGELRDVLTGGGGGGEEVKPLQAKAVMPFYGALHQQGTSRMPARPVVKLAEADRARWAAIVAGYLDKLAGQELSGG
jgi:phage gpG-like protein